MNPVTWMVPTLAALGLYGAGQVLVKKYISEVPPARYCLYFFFAKSAVNIGYFAYYYASSKTGAGADLSALPAGAFMVGILAYVIEGAAWVCYYESVARGPVSIVGTMSAAYAAPNVLFAYLFLGERLLGHQYVGVVFVIVGCVVLGYAPAEEGEEKKGKAWIPLALTALGLWGVWQTLVKHTYDAYGVNDAQMALFNVAGAFSTLGVYGLARGRGGESAPGLWKLAIVPTAVMAGGDLAVIVATLTGKVGVVTPISGAYPVVTLGIARVVLKERISRFQWAAVCLIVAGMIASMLGSVDFG